jgi:hypothetical protein
MATATIDQLLAEERYARERYDLYKAKAYSGRPVSASRLRELERVADGAKARLRRARATPERAAVAVGGVHPRVPEPGASSEQPKRDSNDALHEVTRVPRSRRIARAIDAERGLMRALDCRPPIIRRLLGRKGRRDAR